MGRLSTPIFNRTKETKLTEKARICRSFWEKGLGFMFRCSIEPDEILLFVMGKETRLGSGVHMLFVFTPLAVIWLNRERRVVDKTFARPFVPWYFPSCPAVYLLEGPVELLSKVEVGDELAFEIP